MNIKLLLFTFFGLLLLSCVSNNEPQNGQSPAKNISIEEIEELLSFTDDSQLDSSKKKVLLDSIKYLILSVESDSIKNQLSASLSYKYFLNRNFKEFKDFNSRVVELSEKLKDTNKLTLSYWDLGIYYLNYTTKIDSAYYSFYQADKLYNYKGDRSSSAKVLYNMARAQYQVNDLVGSEVTLSRAISIFKDFDNYTELYNSYNILGSVNRVLEEYDEAITYYNKALDYLDNTPEDDINKIVILNNKGVVYKDKGDYEKAIVHYKDALDNKDIYIKSPKLYSSLLDNLAYSKFKLRDTLGIEKLFYKSLNIRDSLSLISGIVINKLHLGEYYAFKSDSLLAIHTLNEAKKLAIRAKNFEDLKEAYLLLADIDKSNSLDYSKKYIALNDSLQKAERKIRNKFARIRFETEEVLNRNQQLSKQRYWITALLITTLLLAILGYIIFSQRNRNNVLEFERMQQRANAEIYNLMLTQQSKLEEGSQREKKRISEELHDGILGRMFGTRLSLGSLNEKDDPESKKTRQLYLEELKSIEEEVRGISHALNNEMFNSEISYLTLVSSLLETQSAISKFDYKVDSDYSIDWENVSGTMKINIYRIIQEAIQNINKHAKASKVTINFEKIENSFVLSIKDNGVGFDVHTKRKGIGLKNIRSRAQNLNGSFKIESTKNSGTTVYIEIPMEIIEKDEETV